MVRLAIVISFLIACVHTYLAQSMILISPLTTIQALHTSEHISHRCTFPNHLNGFFLILSSLKDAPISY